MESFFPIIIIVIISIISSIIKKAGQKNTETQNQKKTTVFDSKGRPVKTTTIAPQGGALADLLREFQKLKETAQTQNKPGFPTPQIKPQTTIERFPNPTEIPLEIDSEEIYEETQLMTGAVSMEDRISVREKALEEFVDENHPIFKGAGKAGESRISSKPQSKFMSEFNQKDNLIRAIIMNEVIGVRKA